MKILQKYWVTKSLIRKLLMASTVDPNLKIFKILNLHLKRQRYVFIWNINLPNNTVPASSEKMNCRMIRSISVSHFSDCIRILWTFSRLPKKYFQSLLSYSTGFYCRITLSPKSTDLKKTVHLIVTIPWFQVQALLWFQNF